MADDSRGPVTTITTATLGGVIAYAFGLGIMAFGIGFYAKAIAVLLIAGSLGYALYQWETLSHWSAKKRAVSVVLFVVATIAAFAWPLRVAWQEGNKSPDDLKVTFLFPDQTQIGTGPITFDATFFNSGRPAEIQDISAAVIEARVTKCCDQLHLEYCEHFAGMTGTFAADPAFNAKTAQGTRMNATGDARWFWFSRVAKDSGTVGQGNIKVVKVQIPGVILSPPYNQAVVCPMILYSDADGKQKGVVCAGYSLSNAPIDARTAKVIAPVPNAPESTFGGPQVPFPYRLLPHGPKADCEAAK